MKMNVKQSMTNYPETTLHDELLSYAYQRMIRGGYRHLPVIDKKANLVGIISDRDFQRAMCPVSYLVEEPISKSDMFQEGARVYEYMSWPVRTLPHTCDLMAAITLMIEEKISAIVITEAEEMIGIVTHEDLLKVLASILMKTEPEHRKKFELVNTSPLHKVSEFLEGWNLDSYLV